MSGPGSVLLSIMMIAAFALACGGAWLVATKRDRTKGALMLVAALVLIGNVVILSL
jgi:hypothetical protein